MSAAGFLGREIRPVVIDGASDERAFARQAAALIGEAKVCAIFGCWTSASRKSVLPIVEQRDHLLIYPTQYEGMESMPPYLLHRRRAESANHSRGELDGGLPSKKTFLSGGLGLGLFEGGERDHPRRSGSLGRRDRGRRISAPR